MVETSKTLASLEMEERVEMAERAEMVLTQGMIKRKKMAETQDTKEILKGKKENRNTRKTR